MILRACTFGGRFRSFVLGMASRWILIGISTAAFCLGVPFFAAAGLSSVANGTTSDFPSDPSLPYRYGVFIGIDKYSRLEDKYQLDGCVNDATALHELFMQRFGVSRSILLTDEQATRDGIGRVFRELVHQIEDAKTRTRDPITVVITYAGHGSRVKRLSSEKDPNSADDTWVASDSTFDGAECDIRGFELSELYTKLSSLGAQVIIISDSCCSGQVYRGAAFAKARYLPRGAEGDLPAGPQDNLFSDFKVDPAQEQVSFPNGSAPLPGFVFFAACGEEQSDFQTSDENQQPCGRLSYVMRNLLLNDVTDETTYDELANQVIAHFAASYPDQNPEFHAAPGKGSELFLRGGFPPANARVLKVDDTTGALQIDTGSLLGAAVGADVSFYASIQELLDHKSPIGTGKITSVTPLTSTVMPDNSADIPITARGVLDFVRMSDFVVATDGIIPDPIIDKLKELDKNNQIELAASGKPFTLSLSYNAARKTVEFYLPSTMAATQPSNAVAPPLRTVSYQGPDDADNVAKNLLYVARVQRLMTLGDHHSKKLFSVALAAGQGSVTQGSSGIQQMNAGTTFTFSVTNTSDEQVFVSILAVGNDGSLSLLYPDEGDNGTVPAHAVQYQIGEPDLLTASIDQQNPPPGATELTRIIMIASSKYTDMAPLTFAPGTGLHATRGGRGQDNELYDLLNDASFGGGRTRSATVTPHDLQWDATNVVFNVVHP